MAKQNGSGEPLRVAIFSRRKARWRRALQAQLPIMLENDPGVETLVLIALYQA